MSGCVSGSVTSTLGYSDLVVGVLFALGAIRLAVFWDFHTVEDFEGLYKGFVQGQAIRPLQPFLRLSTHRRSPQGGSFAHPLRTARILQAQPPQIWGRYR